MFYTVQKLLRELLEKYKNKRETSLSLMAQTQLLGGNFGEILVSAW
ncbi:hypothetical protein PTUN_b0156 [Pseudoalteromonas tunicata]|jgi:hypothetical protein|nr:hypothetical protein PTUN_b0156 [Pseudoalteromonas tunicata]